MSSDERQRSMAKQIGPVRRSTRMRAMSTGRAIKLVPAKSGFDEAFGTTALDKGLKLAGRA